MNIAGYNITIFEDKHKNRGTGATTLQGGQPETVLYKKFCKTSVFDMFWESMHLELRHDDDLEKHK